MVTVIRKERLPDILRRQFVLSAGVQSRSARRMRTTNSWKRKAAGNSALPPPKSIRRERIPFPKTFLVPVGVRQGSLRDSLEPHHLVRSEVPADHRQVLPQLLLVPRTDDHAG